VDLLKWIASAVYNRLKGASLSRPWLIKQAQADLEILNRPFLLLPYRLWNFYSNNTKMLIQFVFSSLNEAHSKYSIPHLWRRRSCAIFFLKTLSNGPRTFMMPPVKCHTLHIWDICLMCLPHHDLQPTLTTEKAHSNGLGIKLVRTLKASGN
jgi:hypothetical protein